MFKIILDLEISKKQALNLKDKQSIFYTIINMYSDYWKLLHESQNNIKTWFSFYIPKKENKIYINISNDRFDWLNLKNFIKDNQNRNIEVNNNINIKYTNLKINKFNNNIFNQYDTLETLSPIYINTSNDKWASNLELDITKDSIDIISKKILENINNYTWITLTNEDVIIVPSFKTRLLTWFDIKHAWSAYYITLFFKPNEVNSININKVKEILMTNFYKSSYTGYFILK